MKNGNYHPGGMRARKAHTFSKPGIRVLLILPLCVSLACEFVQVFKEAPLEPTATTLPSETLPPEPTQTSTEEPTITPTATQTLRPTPILPTATQEPLIILDKAFAASQKKNCNTDTQITAVVGTNLTVKGTVSIVNGKLTIFCYGAKHTWIGKLTYQGYTFDSDAADPLQFMLNDQEEYIYIKGKGTVTFPNGQSYTMGGGTGVGATAPQWQVAHSWDFSSDTGDWFTGPEEYNNLHTLINIRDGVYNWMLNFLSGDSLVNYYEAPVGEFSDFWISLEAQQINGPDDASTGILFLLNQSTMDRCQFMVHAPTQQYRINCRRKAEWEVMQDWSPASSINKTGWNKLEVKSEGLRIQFFINGTLLPYSFNESVLKSGQLAVAAFISQAGSEYKFEFDNIAIQIPAQ